MSDSAYAEKLKDPRWQKKRLEIFQRDNFTCQWCQATTIPLAVHHLKYLTDTNPWDYPDELLLTLCENCHSNEKYRATVQQRLLDILLPIFSTSDLEALCNALSRYGDVYLLKQLAWATTIADGASLKEGMTDTLLSNGYYVEPIPTMGHRNGPTT